MWTEQRIKYILADLTDENLFACRSLLSDITLSFSEEVQTLAISLQDRAELILNPGFLNKYIHNESDLKELILSTCDKISMQEMANARKAKQEELARASAKNKKFWKDMRQIGMLVLLVVVLVPAAVGALLAYLTR